MHQLERRLTRLEPKRGGRMFWIEAASEPEADRILAENDAQAGDLAILTCPRIFGPSIS